MLLQEGHMRTSQPSSLCEQPLSVRETPRKYFVDHLTY